MVHEALENVVQAVLEEANRPSLVLERRYRLDVFIDIYSDEVAPDICNHDDGEEIGHARQVTNMAHKEMKGLLNLGKCQRVDFAGQIAALSLCMMQYNILDAVKRFESYETIGGLFAELSGETVELTVVQRI